MKALPPNLKLNTLASWARVGALLGAACLSASAWGVLTVNSGNGTVTDTTTSLVWDQCPYGLSGATCSSGTALLANWPQALAAAVAANATSYKGFTDWRVPNVAELESIAKIDSYTAGQPAIDTAAFPNTPISGGSWHWGATWTSTTYAPIPSYAWFVGFGVGYASADSKTFSVCVRLVRSGQSLASFDSLNPGADTTAPTLSAVGLSGIGQTSATLTATSDEAGTGYWMVVAAGATEPSAAQVNSLANYAGVTVVASGSGAMTAAVPRDFTVSGLAAGSNYDFYVVATDANANLSATPVKVQGSTLAPATRLINLSTRGQVQTGDNVMIGGFIIQGSASKTVLIRAGGPSIGNSIPGVLQNPKLDLYSGPSVIASNDDWGTASNAAAITASNLAPSSPLESAILTTLAPGAYTAIVSGVGGTSGVGIIEVFEVDHPEYQLINISTRGQVQTGNNVMIGGFIIQGTTNQIVLIRAGGPTLANYGVTGVLADPMLELHRSSDGAVIDSNDNWGTASNAAAIQATGLAPVDPKESAILISLPPGAYTAIVSGADGGTGVGIVEVFAQ